MKPKNSGYYRMLWNEYARRIYFSWHRTRKGAEAIPKAYRYRGSVASDYYHHLCEGAEGLRQFAIQSGLRIDWKLGYLISERDMDKHICPPDMDERAMQVVLAEMSGKVKQLPTKRSGWTCPVCGEPWEKDRRD